MIELTKVQAIKATIERYERVLSDISATHRAIKHNLVEYRTAENHAANDIAVRLGYSDIREVKNLCFLCEHGSQYEDSGDINDMCDVCPIKSNSIGRGDPCMKSEVELSYLGEARTATVHSPYARLYAVTQGHLYYMYRAPAVKGYIREILKILNHYLHYETEGAEGKVYKTL